MNIETLQQYTSIVASACFILALKWLSRPLTARRGVKIGEFGMVAAVVGALLTRGMDYNWIILGLVLGALIGLPLAIFMPMKDVPQRTALSHSFGGLAAAVVGTAEYYLHARAGAVPLTPIDMTVLVPDARLGYLTFTTRLMAFGNLQ